MTNNKNSDQKKPGEKEPGTFHYNPGNMSGKTMGIRKDDQTGHQADADTIERQNKKDQKR
jgi:hypothetical protein